MILVTPEFQKTVEDLIKNLQPEDFSDGCEYQLSIKHRALPIGLDLWSYVLFTPNGEVIWDDTEGEVNKSSALQFLIRVIVSGKRRYPQLEKLIPSRPEESEDCPFCQGKETSEHSRVLSTDKPGKCVFCAGLGWVTREFYNEVSANFKD